MKICTALPRRGLITAKSVTEATAMSAAQNLPDDAVAVRHAIRSGRLSGHTSGMAAGFVQGNVAHAPSSMLVTDLRHAG